MRTRELLAAALLVAGCGTDPSTVGKVDRRSAALNQVTATPAALSGVVRFHGGFVPDELQVDARDVNGNYTATTRPFGATQDPNDPNCQPGTADYCYTIQVESALATKYVLRPVAYRHTNPPYRNDRIPFLPSAQVTLAGAGNPVTAPPIDYTPAVVTGAVAVSDLGHQPLPLLSYYMSFNDLDNTYVESCGGSADFCPHNPVTNAVTPPYTAYLSPGHDYDFLTQGISIVEGPGAQTDFTYDPGLHLGTLAQGQTLVADRIFTQSAEVTGDAQLPVPIYNIWMTVVGTTQNHRPFNSGYRTLNYLGPNTPPLANTHYVGRVFDNADLTQPVSLSPSFTLSTDGATSLQFPPVPLDFSQGNQITRDFQGDYATIHGRVTLVPPYPIKNGVYPGVQAAESDIGGYGFAQTTYTTDANGASFVIPSFGTPAFTGNWNLWRFGWNIDLGDPNFTSTYFVGQFLTIPVQVQSGANVNPPAFTFQTALVKVYYSAPANPPGTTITDPRLTAYSDDGDSADASGLNQANVATGEVRMVLRAHNNGNGPVAFHLTPSAVINAGGAPGASRTDFGPITLFPNGGDVTVVGVPGSIALTLSAPQEGQVFQVCDIPVAGLSTGQPGIGITVNNQQVAAPSTNNPGDPLQISFNTHLFPAPGAFTVTVTASDGSGHSVTDVRHVSCVHPVNHAPQITCPGAQALACASNLGAKGAVTVGLADADNDPLQITWMVDGNPVQTDMTAPGAASDSYAGTFSPYGHTVIVTATDGWGGSASCTATVDVPNPLVSTTVQKSQLVNPDHTLVNVGWKFSVNDRCASVATRAVAVFSNEPDVAMSDPDGLYSPDAKTVNIPNTQVTTQVRLRNERAAAGPGRVYLIVHTVTDVNGHAGYGCSTVTVPLDGTQASLNAVAALAQQAQQACTGTGGVPNGWVQVGNGPVAGPYQ